MSQTENTMEFVRYILEQLCENKSAIQVEANDDDRGTLMTITVATEDMGRLIGKSGQTIDAVRLLVKTMGARDNQRIYLKVLEPAGE